MMLNIFNGRASRKSGSRTVIGKVCRSSGLFRFAAGCLLLLFLLAGCATAPPPSAPPPSPPGYPKPYKVLGKWYQPLPHARDFRQRGIASWYGEDFHGKKTSNGEIYDMHAMTAAHKTLPLGTVVKVTNLTNGRTAQVRINDRGPFVRGRIIDLSYSAARTLDLVDKGTAPVQIVVLGAVSAPEVAVKPGGDLAANYFYSGNFTVQVNAFKIRANAERLKSELEKRFKNVHITEFRDGRDIFYRVRVGRCTSLQQADEYEAIMIREGFKDAFAVAEDQR